MKWSVWPVVLLLPVSFAFQDRPTPDVGGMTVKAAAATFAVRGRIKDARGVPASTALKLRLYKDGRSVVEASIFRDGVFVFPAVAPGEYTFETNPMLPVPAVPPVTPKSVVVLNKDVDNVDVTIPAVGHLPVHLTFPDGRIPAQVMFSLTDGPRTFKVEAGRRSDGAWTAVFPEGAFRVVLNTLGYTAASMMHGDMDLSQGPLKIAAGSADTLRLELAFDESLSMMVPLMSAMAQSDSKTAAPPPLVTEDALASSCISCPPPAYPALASAARVEGTVVVEIVVGKDGAVRTAKVAKGHTLLAPAAVAAVSQWKYRPQTADGEPVEVTSTVTFPFVLRAR